MAWVLCVIIARMLVEKMLLTRWDGCRDLLNFNALDRVISGVLFYIHRIVIFSCVCLQFRLGFMFHS